jgi:hypothetical protein
MPTRRITRPLTPHQIEIQTYRRLERAGWLSALKDINASLLGGDLAEVRRKIEGLLDWDFTETA